MSDIGIVLRGGATSGSAARAQRPALSYDSIVTLSYQELNDQVQRIAAALIKLGVVPGARVGILLANSIEYVVCYFAIARIGAISVRLNWRLAADELQHALQDSGATITFTHAQYLPTLLAASTQQKQQIIVVPDPTASANPDDNAAEIPATALNYAELHGELAANHPLPEACQTSMIMYTSGTTGRPKGAVWTHHNTLMFALSQLLRWKYDESTVTLSTGPLFHVGSFEDHIIPTLLAGGHAIISKSGSFSILHTCELIAHHQVTHSLIYPFMIETLATDPEIPASHLDSMQVITSGGSPVIPRTTEKFAAKFPHIKLEQVYGLTEGGGISTALPGTALATHPISAGIPLPLNEVRIADPALPAQDAPPGETGEIWVRSPAISGIYWNNPAASAAGFSNGWCHTGDLGYLSADGYLYITGRLKDMIISGGENIYPAELEATLSQLPGIKEISIFGVPDPKFQETVCAVVVAADPQNPITAAEITAFARAHLAGYKRPRHIHFLDQLPRNASGKIMKSQLQAQFSGAESA